MCLLIVHVKRKIARIAAARLQRGRSEPTANRKRHAGNVILRGNLIVIS